MLPYDEELQFPVIRSSMFLVIEPKATVSRDACLVAALLRRQKSRNGSEDWLT